MVYFSAVQSNNAPTEDEGDDDESDLDDQNNPDEYDEENDKGLEISTMKPCIRAS